ncbi:hypothetical protein RJG79_06220 [Mycoplasmatota bacterium WC44]
MTTGIILASVLVVYSMAKTLYLIKTKKENKLLNFDLSILKSDKRKEFSNYVTNLFSNLTFFYGMIIYLVDLYSDYELLIGIILIILTIIQDYYFIKKVFPNEFNKLKTRR